MCQQHNADLVVINNEHENSFIKNHITGDYWIGLNDRRGRGIWSWLDEDAESSFTDWGGAVTLPNRSQEKNCVCVLSHPNNIGQWVNVRCDNKAGYICMSSESISHQSTQFEGHYYTVHLEQHSWNHARIDCQNPPGTSELATIRNDSATFHQLAHRRTLCCCILDRGSFAKAT